MPVGGSVMRICKMCGKEFEGYRSQKYCKECQEKRKPKTRKFIEIGKTYGNIRVDGMANRGYRSYKCHCVKCGRDFEASGATVFEYADTGCGTCRGNERIANREDEYRSYIGKKFGYLEVKDFAGYAKTSKNKTNEDPVMKCVCSICGSETEIPLVRLKAGRAKTCVKCARKNLKAGNEIKEMANVDGTLITAIDGRRTLNKNSSSGYNGVSWMPKLGKYRAYIYFKRKQYHLGSYERIEDAIAARKEGEKAIYGNFLEWYKESYPDQWEKIQKTKK